MEVKVGASTLELVEGDITRQDTEAIVNAANAALRPGGGVDGAIHRAGGPAIEAECRQLGGCPTGEARVTTGGNLKARYVIHTVGPVYQDGCHREPELLSLVLPGEPEARIGPGHKIPGLSVHLHRRLRLPHRGRGPDRLEDRDRLPGPPPGDRAGPFGAVRAGRLRSLCPGLRGVVNQENHPDGIATGGGQKKGPTARRWGRMQQED